MRKHRIQCIAIEWEIGKESCDWLLAGTWHWLQLAHITGPLGTMRMVMALRIQTHKYWHRSRCVSTAHRPHITYADKNTLTPTPSNTGLYEYSDWICYCEHLLFDRPANDHHDQRQWQRPHQIPIIGMINVWPGSRCDVSPRCVRRQPHIGGPKCVANRF